MWFLVRLVALAALLPGDLVTVYRRVSNCFFLKLSSVKEPRGLVSSGDGVRS